MMRRRLVIYTSLLSAGITAGYFVMEKNKVAWGLGFFIGVLLLTVYSVPTADKMKCIIFLILGAALFVNAYLYYDASFYLHEGMVSGRIINVSEKKNCIRLIIKDKNGMRMLLDIDSNGYENGKWIDLAGAEGNFSGILKEFDSADNPGCFDYRLYMRSKGVVCRISAKSIEIGSSDTGPIWMFRRAIYHKREEFLNRFDEDIRGFLKGIIFGDKSEVDDEILEDFNFNSAGHILAVSGLHIGFLYTLLRIVTRNKKTWFVSLFIIAVLIMYGEMTLWSSSTIRAIIVLSMSMLSVNLRRRFDLLSSLAASAFFILLLRPYMLLNSGFQLSFAAMGALAFIGERAGSLFGKVIGPALSVQIGTMPLIALIYKRFNILSFLINIPIIILSSLLVPMCITLLALDFIFGLVPDFSVKTIELLCDWIILINKTLSAEGSFSNLASDVTPALVIVMYLMLIFIPCEWTRIRLIRRDYENILKVVTLSLIPVIMMSIVLYDSFRDDEIVFVAVGQGDCTHIRSGSEDVLIDGGGSDHINIGEKILMPYLLSQGASNLDLAAVTHLHNDHYLGIAELSEIYPVISVSIPDDYREYYELKATSIDRSEALKSGADSGVNEFKCSNITYLNHDSYIKVSDDTGIEVLWPDASNCKSVSADDANEHNMVYMIHFRGVKIMITGDLLEEDELKMVRKYKGTDRLKCDILKVAHHGSKSSSTEAFLDAASPEIAVIQVGRNNVYGHPHQQTLDRLEARGISTYRTDTDGAVGVDITRNGEIRVHTMH